MIEVDRLILGDNQFFGVNHMSQEKGKDTLEQFKDINEIKRILYYSMEKGVKGVFFSTHPKIYEICDMIRNDDNLRRNFAIYVNVPYIVKYVSMVTEIGISNTIRKVLGENKKNRFIYALKSSINLLTLDHIGIMKRLIDAEMAPFNGLNVKSIFLHNTLCDLILGYEMDSVIIEFDKYIRKEYRAIPGYGTLNLPLFSKYLNGLGLNESLIMTGINKLGFLMNPNIEYCEAELKDTKHTIIAMATLASGALTPQAAYDYISKLPVDSIIVGLSSEKHADETFGIISEKFLKKE